MDVAREDKGAGLGHLCGGGDRRRGCAEQDKGHGPPCTRGRASPRLVLMPCAGRSWLRAFQQTRTEGLSGMNGNLGSF